MSGTAVNYEPPAAQSGEPPVTVECVPASGGPFPIGSTSVNCVATDALKRMASCTFAVTVTATPRLRLTHFLAFGDSVTVGEIVIAGTDDVELKAVPEAAYPAVLQQLLTARYGLQSASVVNAGLSGEKAQDAMRRFASTFRGASPDAVIILEGYNDLLYSERTTGLAALEAGVSAVAADARNRGARVFISTLAPTKPGRRQIPLAVIQAANDRLRVIARGEGALLIDVFNPLLPELGSNIGSDGLHPTELGYRRIAAAVFAAIRADLELPSAATMTNR